MSDFDDIIPEFITESTDLLPDVESGLLEIEAGTASEDTVHTIFRAIHSIKGGAGFVGLNKIERLAHKMEDVLNLIRNMDLEPTKPVTEALLSSLDVLNSLFDRVEEHEQIDIETSIALLEASLQSNVAPEVRAALCSFGHSISEAGLPYFEVNRYNLEQALNQGNLYCLKLRFSQMEERGMPPLRLVDELLSIGEIMDSTIVQMGENDTNEVGLAVLYSTILESDLLAAALSLDKNEYSTVSLDNFDLTCDDQEESMLATAPEHGRPASAAPQAPAMAAQPAPAAPNPAAGAAGASPQAPPPMPSHQAQAGNIAQRPMAASDPAEPSGLPGLAPQEAQVVQPREYLTFVLDGKTYGVDILSVQEIIGLTSFTRLPRAPKHILGVINLRGMVVPVQDLRIRLNLPIDENSDPVVVVLLVGGKIMGAVVDAVDDVVELDPETIQDPPPKAGAFRREFLRGLCRHEERLIILLDIGKLLVPEKLDHAA